MRWSGIALLCVLSPLAQASKQSPTSTAALQFIENDFSQALADARKTHRPLFVDAWAPWCHTCRSMRSFVFTNPLIAAQARRFVWLSVDTERTANADFLASHPVSVWPTLMIINPETGSTVLRWAGSADAQALLKLLDDGERLVRGGGDAGARAIAVADALAAQGKAREAAAAYRSALDVADAAQKPRVVEALVTALYLAHDMPSCARAALELTPSLPRGTSFVNAIALGLDCAGGSDPATAQLRSGLIALARDGLKIADLVPDDRSALYDSVVRAYDADHAEAARKDMAQRWFAFLATEVDKATTAERRAVFDSHLVSAATALGDPLRAVPALSASERAAPDDYNPPARLAAVYFRAGKLEDAQAAADRALAKVYGPRRIEVQLLKARILYQKGDHAGGQQMIEQALAVAKSLPVSQRRDDMIARVKKQQAELAH